MDGQLERATTFSFVSVRMRLACGLATLIVAGCGHHESLPYPDYAPKVSTNESPGDVTNAYVDYERAAVECDKALADRTTYFLTRTSFSQKERSGLQKRLAPSIALIRSGAGKTCRIPYIPSSDKSVLQYRSEWRRISDVLRWNIQDALVKKNFDAAIGATLLSTKFGFDLTGGNPGDVSLGFIVVDETRREIAPNLMNLSPVQLSRFSQGLKKIYLSRPSITGAMDYVAKGMLQSVQDVQTSFQKKEFDALNAKMGDGVREALTYVKDLSEQPDAKRAVYFEGFAKEARENGQKLVSDAAIPFAQRTAPPALSKADRPWRRLGQRLFAVGKPLLAMNDETCARTQMLVVESQLLIKLKTEGKVPTSLSKFNPKLTTDPISGQIFLYKSNGKDFKLYSEGTDLVDNDGKTDATFRSPDLLLEMPDR